MAEIPGVMVPIAIKLPPPTSSKVIGLASAPSGSGSMTSRLSPPGNSGARMDGKTVGRLSAGDSSLISAGEAAVSAEAIGPCRSARSSARTATVTMSVPRKIQRKMACSPLSTSQD